MRLHQLTYTASIMATSSETLSRIITELVKAKPGDYDAAVELLAAKGFLPKKMTEKKPAKKVSVFASKAAEEFAEAKGLAWPEGKEGSGNNGKVTVKDLKSLAEPKSAKKVNASPTALQYARDNGLDISKIASGSGAEGKILLKDVKDLKVPDAVEKGEESEDEGTKLKVSPSAAKLMKQYEIDEEDLAEIEPSGKGGTIVAADLKELIDLIKEEQE